TYSSVRLHRCQSLQWYPSGKCVLNKGSHLGSYDLIEDRGSIYQYINCDIQVLLDIASRVCSSMNTSNPPGEPSVRSRSKTTTEKPASKRPTHHDEDSEVPTAVWKFLTTPASTSPSTTTEAAEQTTTEENISTTSKEESTEVPTTETTTATTTEVTETSTVTTVAIEETQSTEREAVESSTSTTEEGRRGKTTEHSSLKPGK
ncbi:hypothetical protein COOONC_00621, partial [Cooperia oncophora]